MWHRGRPPYLLRGSQTLETPGALHLCRLHRHEFEDLHGEASLSLTQERVAVGVRAGCLQRFGFHDCVSVVVAGGGARSVVADGAPGAEGRTGVHHGGSELAHPGAPRLHLLGGLLRGVVLHRRCRAPVQEQELAHLRLLSSLGELVRPPGRGTCAPTEADEQVARESTASDGGFRRDGGSGREGSRANRPGWQREAGGGRREAGGQRARRRLPRSPSSTRSRTATAPSTGSARFSTGKPATLSRSMASSSGGRGARGAAAVAVPGAPALPRARLAAPLAAAPSGAALLAAAPSAAAPSAVALPAVALPAVALPAVALPAVAPPAVAPPAVAPPAAPSAPPAATVPGPACSASRRPMLASRSLISRTDWGPRFSIASNSASVREDRSSNVWMPTRRRLL